MDDLGLEVTGQGIEPDRAVLACRVVEPDGWCHRCGCQGQPRDTVTRRLAHEPFGWRPTQLEVTVRRYRSSDCGHVWRQDTTAAAERAEARLSRRAIRWALESLVVAHLSMARVADGLGVAWGTASAAVLAEGQRTLIDDPARFDGVAVVGVDEHVWSHTCRRDRFVTVVIDLTPIRDSTGPARLLDMVPGRSKQAFKQWLADRPQAWRDQVEVVAMWGSPRLRGRLHWLQIRRRAGGPRRRDRDGPSPRASVARVGPSTSSAWPGTPWSDAAAGCSRTSTAIAGVPVTRSTAAAGPC